MKAYRLYFIRHGLTAANADGRYIGSTDLPLSEEGAAQLERMAQTYEYPKVQKVYTSPLARAVQSALTLYPDTYTVTVDALREMDFGEFENRSLADLAQDASYRAWMDGGMADAPQGGENREQFAQRICLGLDAVIRDMMDNAVTAAAVVGHAGVLSALLAQFGVPRRRPVDWKLGPGEGYTLLTSAQMWARDHLCEVFDPLPYGLREADPAGYAALDLPEEE